MEKFILDIEMLQTFAEIFDPLKSDEAELAYDAIASVEPGSHFFGCEHTMERYQHTPDIRRLLNPTPDMSKIVLVFLSKCTSKFFFFQLNYELVGHYNGNYGG
jgi:hypothetical protein